MKRREFLIGTAGIMGATLPNLARAQAGPCPVPMISAGGTPVATPCTNSNLVSAAAALSAGQSATSLGDSGLSSDALFTIQWSNRFHYDHSNSRGHLLGKTAASQGSERSNCLYDAVTNRWTAALFGGSELGHVYESIAYDPGAGEVYTGIWPNGGAAAASRYLKKWTIGTPLTQWTEPATASLGSYINSDTQPTICWHPNLFGPGDGGILALKNEGFADETVVAWRRNTNSWQTVSGTAHPLGGSYQSNGAIEYVRGGDFCIAAFDQSEGGRTFRIPAGSSGSLATAAQVSNVPIHCGYTGAGGNVGILIDDPTGSPTPYILEKGGSNRVWKFNNGSWTLKSYRHPLPAGGATSDTNWIVASVFPLGVFWAKTNSPSRPSMLWRPDD